MAAPLVLIVGRLFARGLATKAGRTVARMALARSIRKMFKGTDVASGIDIQSHTSAKVKAKGKPINMPTPLFDKEFWDKLGANLVNRYRHHIFDNASPRDAYGQPFKEYSAGYANRKKTGAMFKQDSSYANSKAPYLTGDLYKDLDYTVDSKNNAIYIGWNAEANKIDWLKNNGRILTDAKYPLPKDVIDKTLSALNKELKKTMPKGTHHIKITAKVHAKATPKAKK